MTALPADPTDLTVVDAARLIRTGEVSPADLVTACLARIRALEPQVGAWVDVYEEEALQAARKAADEAARARRSGEPLGPLHGVPFGVKDVFDVAGKPTRAGSKSFLREPDRHADAVQAVLDAGGILLGKTTTAELVFSDAPATRNPWNVNHSPGGSSSGSAAAIAARMVPFALGTQTVGSLVRPAAFCANSTVKATYGAVSRRGVVPSSWSLDHVGALSRTMADQTLLLPVLMNTAEGKGETLLPQGVKPDQFGEWAADNVKGMVVGIPDRFFFTDDVDPAVRAAFDGAVTALEDLGVVFAEVKLPPSFETAQSALQLILRSEAAAYHKDSYRERYDLMGPKIRRMLTSGNMVPAAAYVRAQQLRRMYIQELTDAMASVQALATPSAPTLAPPGLEFTGSPIFNGPFSLAGFPAAGFPSGFDEDTGLPTGFQVVSHPGDERTVLMIGAAFQHVTSWHQRKPAILQDAA